MSDYPHTCDCGKPCYRGATTIECTNAECRHFTADFDAVPEIDFVLTSVPVHMKPSKVRVPKPKVRLTVYIPEECVGGRLWMGDAQGKHYADFTINQGGHYYFDVLDGEEVIITMRKNLGVSSKLPNSVLLPFRLKVHASAHGNTIVYVPAKDDTIR